MKLDDKQKERLIEYMENKWPEPQTCPICKNTEWGISDTIFEIREFFDGKMIISGTSIPLIASTCRSCGYTVLFNAIILGFVKPDEKKVVEPDKKESEK